MKVLLLTLMALALDISQARAVGQAAHILPLQFGNPVVGEPFSGTRTLDMSLQRTRPILLPCMLKRS